MQENFGLLFRTLTVGTEIIADPEICFQEFISEIFLFYCGIGPAWNLLSFPQALLGISYRFQ